LIDATGVRYIDINLFLPHLSSPLIAYLFRSVIGTRINTGGTSVTLCWVTLVTSDDGMIKINYFDERELLVRREIETKAPKGTEAKGTQVLPTHKRKLD